MDEDEDDVPSWMVERASIVVKDKVTGEVVESIDRRLNVDTSGGATGEVSSMSPGGRTPLSPGNQPGISPGAKGGKLLSPGKGGLQSPGGTPAAGGGGGAKSVPQPNLPAGFAGGNMTIDIEGELNQYGTSSHYQSDDKIREDVANALAEVERIAPERERMYRSRMLNIRSPLDKKLTQMHASIAAGFRTYNGSAYAPIPRFFHESLVPKQHGKQQEVRVEVARRRRQNLVDQESQRRLLLQIEIDEREGYRKEVKASLFGADAMKSIGLM